jgi:hypothetical protein
MPGAYAIVVDGGGKATEHLLGHHTAGAVLNTSVQVLKSSVADGKRTVVLRRALAGLTAQHHTFDPKRLSLDFITALGSGPTFGYHKALNHQKRRFPAPRAAACLVHYLVTIVKGY